ncbi:MAG: O-antigen ligase family protein [Proteobacteria bacterium]|nr:O-antigen ligase family protein [Pseudomonadota bacterium]
MYLRPQEYYTFLQKAPMLYIFFAAAVGGLIVDFKLRLLKPVRSRTLWIAIAFYAWVIIVDILKVPGPEKVPTIIKFTIVFVTYVVIAHAAQSFRAFRFIAGTMIFIGIFLTVVGVHQGTAAQGCMIRQGFKLGTGIPDGRPCETVVQCLGVDAEPGAQYECQRIGLFGTSALNDRVRYRGELQDPNELALVVVATLPLIFAFATRKRRLRATLLAVAALVLITQCIINTQSRGGMLILMAALGVYFVKRFGIKYIFIGILAALPLMAMGGRSGSAADESTRGRYEAWRSGLQMFKSDPVFGVGHKMFTNYHHLTAHNSYVLAMAELGLIGMCLWVAILYLSIKVPIMAMWDFAHDARAGPARAWGLALIAMAAVYCIQMLFLSLTYHTITWVLFGLSGAFYSAIKRHAPDWEVEFGPIDIALVIAGCVGFIMVLPVFLALKGA